MDEEFLLLYYVKGMTPDRIHSLSPWERIWYLESLDNQLKREADAIKKAFGG